MRKLNNKILGVMIKNGDFIPDYIYLKLYTKLKTGKEYNLKKPKSFNEKINWLKLHDRREILSICADKYRVREFIKEKIGEEYLIKLLWHGENPDDIPFETLPNKFVLKTNGGSGTNIIVNDKELLDYNSTRKQLREWLDRNYFYPKREWAYKNIPPMIVCEEFIEQENNQELRDYRFFCFNGEPKFISVDFSITDKSKTRRNLYSLEWELMEEEITYPKEKQIIVEKPKKLEEMIKLSKVLAKKFPHVRIDFYYINDEIYFGEMTFYHQSGMGDIRPDSFNEKMGNWIDLGIIS